MEIEGKKLTLVGSLEQGECKFILGKKITEADEKEGGAYYTIIFNTSSGI